MDALDFVIQNRKHLRCGSNESFADTFDGEPNGVKRTAELMGHVSVDLLILVDFLLGFSVECRNRIHYEEYFWWEFNNIFGFGYGIVCEFFGI